MRASAGFLLALAVLFGLLAATGRLETAGLAASGKPVVFDDYLVLAFGVLSAMLVGTGLITLVFYSSGAGYDEPPRFR